MDSNFLHLASRTGRREDMAGQDSCGPPSSTLWNKGKHTLSSCQALSIFISHSHSLLFTYSFIHYLSLRNHLYQFLSVSLSLCLCLCLCLSCVHLPVSNCLILERLIKASLSLSHHHFLMLSSLSVSLRLSLSPWWGHG